MLSVLRFEDGRSVDLTEPSGVVLRFRIAEHLARMRYGTAIVLPSELVMKCWPPTGDHAPRPYISAKDMMVLVDSLLSEDRGQYVQRPETSYTSLERVTNDLPNDGSFSVTTAFSSLGEPSGIKVYRSLKSCPRCGGSGFEEYANPLASLSTGRLSKVSEATSTFVVRRRLCDHRPKGKP